MILSHESPEDEDLENKRFVEIYQEATDIYGLLHARYILTDRGMALMREKFLNGVFGNCPRILCSGQNVIPIGMSEQLKHSRVKVFCPRCEEVYMPKKKCQDIDGAYFGTSLPHIMIKTYPELSPKAPKTTFEPRIFGFRVSGKQGSLSGPLKD